MKENTRYDEIGPWSEIKLEILRKYAAAYSRIMAAQERLSHMYIDAFAGAGIHLSKTTGDFVPGSPVNALLVRPPFKEYHFIDLDGENVQSLKEKARQNDNVFIYEGDCNKILLEQVFPRVRYKDYKRGLCLLDPYGLHLNWEVIARAASMRTMEIFLNFPIADMNRNVLLRDPDKVVAGQRKRMNAFWGDESWFEIAYGSGAQFELFEDIPRKGPNEAVVEGFHKRLKDAAGFEYVSDPLPMKNSRNAVVYYLFFASHNRTGEKIVSEIFRKYA
jgi:three-Cys-motif partner protein